MIVLSILEAKGGASDTVQSAVHCTKRALVGWEFAANFDWTTHVQTPPPRALDREKRVPWSIHMEQPSFKGLGLNLPYLQSRWEGEGGYIMHLNPKQSPCQHLPTRLP